MVIDARGRVNNGGIFPGSLFDDRVNLFEYKVLARQKVNVEACQPFSKWPFEMT